MESTIKKEGISKQVMKKAERDYMGTMEKEMVDMVKPDEGQKNFWICGENSWLW